MGEKMDKKLGKDIGIDIEKLIPKRDANAHKGDFGHVLIIGGEPGYSGAVLMAAQAALRVGAGLVSIATHPKHAGFLNLAQPEVMVHAIESDFDLDKLLKLASVILIGPGMCESWWSQQLLDYCFVKDEGVKLCADLPFIVDAGAFFRIKKLKLKKDNWILTPHPKEAANLLGVNLNHVLDKRLEKTQRLQEQYGGVAVLKGHQTIINYGDKDDISICPHGNPGMAVGGMGDVLAGMISGFAAQKISLRDAAVLGVFIHAYSADIAVKDIGKLSLLPTDLFRYISVILRSFF